jgi:hypothetical protein
MNKRVVSHMSRGVTVVLCCTPSVNLMEINGERSPVAMLSVSFLLLPVSESSFYLAQERDHYKVKDTE